MSTGAKRIFEQYKEGGIEYLNGLVEKEVETRLLDFKEVKSRTGLGSDDDKRSYSKALSGFANSEGGVIVWGVKCKRAEKDDADVVKEVIPIKGLTKFISDLHSLEADMVSPGVPGVEHYPINLKSDSDAGFALSYIPKSETLPHMAMQADLKRFYYRAGNTFQFMPQWMLADRFGRRPQPVLELDWQSNSNGHDYVALELLAVNTSSAIAKYPSFAVKRLSGGQNINFQGIDKNFHLENREEAWFGRGIASMVIHPKQATPICYWTILTSAGAPEDNRIQVTIWCEGFASGDMVLALPKAVALEGKSRSI